MLGRTLGIALANALLLWVAPLGVAEAAVISVGPYMPSTTMPFVVPIEISGALDLVNWQFDLAFDPSDVQVNLACDPFSDPCCDLIFGPVTEGPFTSSGGMFQTLFVPGAVDNITGLLSIVAGGYAAFRTPVIRRNTLFIQIGNRAR